ncbi:MAG: hypothetical protein HOP26_02880 [Methylotenera sp.]|jgi:lambda repressor-like predicted transcriptional regulator|nr:hypothetical protein [Methylotenera sp.]
MLCKQQMMNADDLNYALKKLGWTQVALSRALQVNICTVNNVIHGRTTSNRIATFIAEQLNASIGQLWPERYFPAGLPHPITTQNQSKNRRMS